MQRTLLTERVWIQVFADFLESQGIHDPTDATRGILTAFEAHLITLESRRGRPYSASARQHILGSVRKLYRGLLERGRILVDPSSGLRLPRTPRKLPRAILSPAQMRRLLAVPDVTTPLGLRDRTILEVLYGTGIRFSELADLRTGDVDLEEGLVWIRQGKGQKDRLLPIGRWARHWLRRYLEANRWRSLHRQTDRVFPTYRGHRLDNDTFNNRLRTYAREAGITKHVTAHAIRHTVATLLLRRGADIRQIQVLMGHATLSATQVYTHVNVEDLRRVQRRYHPREKRPR